MRVFITGGAGFIGCNVAAHHLAEGDDVTVFDDLSRRGSKDNVAWLESNWNSELRVVTGDIRDAGAVAEALDADTDRIYHLAAQVAVTSSVLDPRLDFEVNALGTLNLLEATRSRAPEAVVLYSSTNKVYGGLEDLDIEELESRYSLPDYPLGIPEDRQLDFHSPYGCSKGAADQYVRDYSRIYGLKTIVFRQSCIYGIRQLGVEDQGWLAHFCISAALQRPITIFGDGKQVRDLLWIDDLVEAYDRAAQRIDKTNGQVYNLGGGPANALAVWAEFGDLLNELTGSVPETRYEGWRQGDQPVFVCDIRKATDDFGWTPSTTPKEGVKRLLDWIDEDHSIFQTH